MNSALPPVTPQQHNALPLHPQCQPLPAAQPHSSEGTEDTQGGTEGSGMGVSVPHPALPVWGVHSWDRGWLKRGCGLVQAGESHRSPRSQSTVLQGHGWHRSSRGRILRSDHSVQWWNWR